MEDNWRSESILVLGIKYGNDYRHFLPSSNIWCSQQRDKHLAADAGEPLAGQDSLSSSLRLFFVLGRCGLREAPPQFGPWCKRARATLATARTFLKRWIAKLIKRRLQGVTTPNQQPRDNFRVPFESGLLEFLSGVLSKNITPENASGVGPHEESGSPDDVPVETKHLAASAGEPLAGQDFIIVVVETLLLLDDVPIEKLLHSVWPVVQEAGRPVLDGSDLPEKMDRQGSRFWDVSGHGFSTQKNFEIN
nr:hypothetical protein Iba_chr13cCG15630 [Ipomoea batatas]